MAYKLIISDRAIEQIDSIVGYVKSTLSSPGAAASILSDINEAFDKLEYMAESFGFCNDRYLMLKGYRKMLLARHNYVIIYCVVGQEVRISGVFHMKEDYAKRL